MAGIIKSGFNLTVDSAIKSAGAIAGQVGLEQIGFLAGKTVSIGPFLSTGGLVAAINVARVGRDWLYSKTHIGSTVERHMNPHVIKFAAEVIDFATIAGLSFAAVSIAPVAAIAGSVNVLGLIALVYVGDKAHSFIKPLATDVVDTIKSTVKDLTTKADPIQNPGDPDTGGAPEVAG